MKNFTVVLEDNLQQAGQLDDYFDRGDHVEFRLTDLGDPNYNMALIIHAVSEYFDMIQDGVTAQDTVDFDMQHLDDDDPGMLPDAPYHPHHCRADVLERAYLAMKGISWAAYDAACLAVIDRHEQTAMQAVKFPRRIDA